MTPSQTLYTSITSGHVPRNVSRARPHMGGAEEEEEKGFSTTMRGDVVYKCDDCSICSFSDEMQCMCHM